MILRINKNKIIDCHIIQILTLWLCNYSFIVFQSGEGVGFYGGDQLVQAIGITF